MTENEVIEALKNEKECVLRNIKGCDRDCGKCDFFIKDSVIIDAYVRAIMELQEIQQYRAIGTVEECREAREKAKAKKPNKRKDRYTDFVQHYSCPVCGRYFGQAGVHNDILFDKLKYCTCGQVIDWSE